MARNPRAIGRGERVGRRAAASKPSLLSVATSVSLPVSATQWVLSVLMVTSATARRLEAGKGEKRRRGGRQGSRRVGGDAGKSEEELGE